MLLKTTETEQSLVWALRIQEFSVFNPDHSSDFTQETFTIIIMQTELRPPTRLKHISHVLIQYFHSDLTDQSGDQSDWSMINDISSFIRWYLQSILIQP